MRKQGFSKKMGAVISVVMLLLAVAVCVCGCSAPSESLTATFVVENQTGYARKFAVKIGFSSNGEDTPDIAEDSYYAQTSLENGATSESFTLTATAKGKSFYDVFGVEPTFFMSTINGSENWGTFVTGIEDTFVGCSLTDGGSYKIILSLQDGLDIATIYKN